MGVWRLQFPGTKQIPAGPARGRFTKTFTAAKDGDWQAKYDGDDWWTFCGYSRLDFVDVQ
ncbi:hypothetical protein ABT317_43055 [Streptomyces carpinensis]|uniref:Uncharacterized protein n=1 Tax=Streptomyces carpinensis TaxID=66369 RepID=A0ABV1WH96_9ACTN